jgi:hypothetical protein
MGTIQNVNDVLVKTQVMIDELTNLEESIRENTKNLQLDSNTNENIRVKSEIVAMKEEQERYDTMFEEEESILQTMGGKTRMQTLQEFVLTFFYSGFFLFSIAIAIYYFLRTGRSGAEFAKAMGVMAFIGLVITGLLIRYA